MKIKSYKKTVWKSCADYVKLREANIHGFLKCITCNKTMHYKDESCNAGHFVPGRGNEVLYDDTHIFPQCAGCNCDGGGEQYKFGEFLKKKYGYDNATLEEILQMRHKSRKYTLEELKEIKRRFDDASNLLRKEKGLK